MTHKTLKKEVLETIARHNNKILMTSCIPGKLKYGKISKYGIEWESVEDYKKEMRENCPLLIHTFILLMNGKVVLLTDTSQIFQ